MDAYCELRRQLAEKFATAARLYAETVVLLARHPLDAEQDYNRLREATERALDRAKAAGVAFDEHVASHHCGTRQTVEGDTAQVQHDTA
jgi:hypothetical protein